jgi:prolyl-tRNA editing enzyme YbaK/EbsC (Cys-tRNA(Pro) deacylase)
VEPVEVSPIPFWVAVGSRALRVLDTRRLGRAARGPYEAARLIPASLSHILVATIYWAGDRPLMLLSTPEILLDLDVVGSWFDERIRPAEPVEVSILAGSDLMAVPPAGDAAMMPVFMDDSLLSLSHLWMPAAEPGLWLSLTPEDLVRVSGAYPVTLRTSATRPLRLDALSQ